MHDKKVILLTGCTGTLGQGLLAHHPDDFVIAGVARHAADELLQPDYFIQADVSQDDEDIVDATLSRFGRIDVLINNAVYYDFGDILDLTKQDLTMQYDTNVVAPILLANNILKKFWLAQGQAANQQHQRSVINVSSIGGVYPLLGEGHCVYSTHKAALNMVTRHMSQEWLAYGITVNAIAPNTFPEIVSTQAVVDAIFDLINAPDKTGVIEVIDDGERYPV